MKATRVLNLSALAVLGLIAAALISASSWAQEGLAAPSDIVLRGADQTSLEIAWSAVPDEAQVEGYGIYRDGSLLASTSGSSYTLSELSCGTAHTVAVDSYDALGNRSDQAAAVVSTAPCSRIGADREPAEAVTGDFRISTYGTTNAIAGDIAAYGFTVTVLDGFPLEQGHGWDLSISGLPPGATAPGLHGGWFEDDYWANDFGIVTTPQTPVGNYEVTISVTKLGLTRSSSFPLNISAMPGPLARVGNPSSNPPLPGLADWEQQMVEYGRRHCDKERIISHSTWEGGMWYYDGARVARQIADYTGDDFFNECATYFNSTYRQYVLDAGGVIPGWRVFTKGFLEGFKRTGDPLDKEALIALATRGLYRDYLTPSGEREHAYALNAHVDAAEFVPLDKQTCRRERACFAALEVGSAIWSDT